MYKDGYTSEKNTLILVSLLKSHNIKKIIVSPGTTNISFVASVQYDKFFEVYSAVDERAAAFMACGLAEESGEPVVLSCTGATASRNYIPGLTEAYYRHLPVLAVTSTQHIGRVSHYVAQVIDRSEQFKDMVKKSYQLPTINSYEDEQTAVTDINNAILNLKYDVPGPVHLNLATVYSNNFNVKELPKYRTIHKVFENSEFPKLPNGKIGIFIGTHVEFTDEETEAIDKFIEANNALVLYEHEGNYRGKYMFRTCLVNSQDNNFGTFDFDLVIYIGYVHGSYVPFKSKTMWRVNEDGIVRDPYHNLTYVFEMSEITFFNHYINDNKNISNYENAIKVEKELLNKLPELPFSNAWVAKNTSNKLPENSILHFSILNTTRVWNYFEIPQSVLAYSNGGGFGIDGCLSSFLGSAKANPTIPHFMIIGDLSFFYDLDAMLNDLPLNIHVMLINNGVGTEFKNYNHRAAYFGDMADDYMAAKGHNGNKSLSLMATMCKNLNVDYINASNKEEYLANEEKFLKSDKPIFFEIFTTDKDESDALKILNTVGQSNSLYHRFKRSKLGNKIKPAIKKVLRRG